MDKITQIKQLTEELLQHCHNYYGLDAPTISDAEYDKKFDTLKRLEDEANFYLANSPTRKVQGEVLPYLEKVRHSVPMLSADKSTDIKDVIKFKGNQMIMASYKLDGSTVVLKYNEGKLYQGLSRGSGTDGENITHTVKMIKNIPITIPYKGYLEIRGEALIPWEYYNAMNTDNSLGHPRNVASGALRQLDANEAGKRHIYFYAFTLVNWRDVCSNTDVLPQKSHTLNFLSYNGFDVVPHYSVPAFDTGSELKKIIDLLDRKSYKNPTDGWCFEYENLEYGESLGSTEHHDRRLFALKPEVEGHDTYFRGIEYNTRRTGVVSMTALFDSVEIGNTMVSRATLHNVDFFNGLELGKGDLITVTKFNEITPGIMDNQTRSGTYKLIDTCPSCGEKLIIKNTGTANILFCPNENCSSRNLAKFTHFVSKNCMNIDGLSEATLEKFISLGYINDFKSIYHLSDHKNKLILLDGFGVKSIEKLLQAIEKSRDVKLENFITALGIEGIGTAAAKTISQHFNGDYEEFINAYFYWHFDWTTLKDFGQVMADNMNTYLHDNLEMINELALEMRFLKYECKQVVDNVLNGLKFCITGSFSQSRDKLKEQLEAKGAKFISSVSKNLDILFCGEKAGSKLAKAQSLGVKVAYEDELMSMLEG